MVKSKILKGFLISPLVPCIIMTIVALDPLVLVLAIPISYFCAIFIGVPIFYFLVKINKINFTTITITGLISSLLPFLLLSIYDWIQSVETAHAITFRGFILFGVFGVMASTSFWYISVKNESNK